MWCFSNSANINILPTSGIEWNDELSNGGDATVHQQIPCVLNTSEKLTTFSAA